MLRDTVVAVTASFRSILAAAASRMASIVTAFRASLSFKSSGFLEPMSMYAWRISSDDWRMRRPDSSMVVDSCSACFVSHWIDSSSSPVKAFSSAWEDSLESRLLRRVFSAIDTPVIVAAPVANKPPHLAKPLLKRDNHPSVSCTSAFIFWSSAVTSLACCW